MAVSEQDLERQAKARTAATLGLVKHHFGLSNVKLGKRAGMATSTVRSKMEGTGCWSWELERLAGAFGVPVSVLHMDPGEAHEWLQENRPGRRDDLPPFPAEAPPLTRTIGGQFKSEMGAAA